MLHIIPLCLLVFNQLHKLQNHVANHKQKAVQQEDMCVNDTTIPKSKHIDLVTFPDFRVVKRLRSRNHRVSNTCVVKTLLEYITLWDRIAHLICLIPIK